MISRFEYLYAKDRILKLEEKIYQYMAADKYYLMYEKYLRLNSEKQIELIKQWDEYYEVVRTTDSYKRFQEMSKLFHADVKDITKIRELKAQAQESLRKGDFLKKPSTEDPRFLKYKVDSVLPVLRSSVNNLKSLVEEYKNVYEPKKDNYDL